MAKARVMTFTFLNVAGEEQRGPMNATALIIRTLDGTGKRIEERFNLPDGATGAACGWYGLKQKLSDYEADAKGEMSGPERLASMRDCHTMLVSGAWEQEREGATMVPPTQEELGAAIQRMFPQVTAEQAKAAIAASEGKAPNADLLSMVRLMRKEAGIAGRTKGGDLGGLFKA